MADPTSKVVLAELNRLLPGRTPEDKRGLAGRLYVMASDAYSFGDARLAEILIARGNQYADEAAQAAQE